MFSHLTRHVKETIESLNLKRFVNACGYSRINTRILKSNFGVCHQLGNRVTCTENAGIGNDNERCKENKKDSWTQSVHLEHSPIGLLGWTTALAIGWCMTQPFHRKCVLPSDRSNWDQAYSLTKTVFAQPGGLSKLDRYLKCNVTNTVYTQTDFKHNDQENFSRHSENSSLSNYGLSNLDRYLKSNATETVLTQTGMKENDDKVSFMCRTKDSSVANSGLTNFDKYPEGNFNNTLFTQTDIEENKKETSTIQSEDYTLPKEDDYSLPKAKRSSFLNKEGSSLLNRECNSLSQSEYSFGSQSEHSLSTRHETPNVLLSEHSSGSQSGYISGSESEYSSENRIECSSGCRAKPKDSFVCQENPYNDESSCSGTKLLNQPKVEPEEFPEFEEFRRECIAFRLWNRGNTALDNLNAQLNQLCIAAKEPTPTEIKIDEEKFLEAVEDLERAENDAIDFYENNRGARDIKPGKCKTMELGFETDFTQKILKGAEELISVRNQILAVSENRLGMKDIKAGKYKTAINHFASSVELGNSRSMFNMGLCYEMGLGVEKDLSQAATYYRMAAEKGHLTAMYNLGVYHLNGWGNVPKDLEHALKLFERAASHGKKEAKDTYSILSSYLEGKKNKKHEGETGCELNTCTASSTLADTQTVQLQHKN